MRRKAERSREGTCGKKSTSAKEEKKNLKKNHTCIAATESNTFEQPYQYIHTYLITHGAKKNTEFKPPLTSQRHRSDLIVFALKCVCVFFRFHFK